MEFPCYPLALLLLSPNDLGGEGPEFIAIPCDLIQRGIERRSEVSELWVPKRALLRPHGEVT